MMVGESDGGRVGDRAEPNGGRVGTYHEGMGDVGTTTAAGRTRCQKREQLLALSDAIVRGEPAADAVRSHAAQHGLSLKRGWSDFRQIRRRWAKVAAQRRQAKDEHLGLALLRFSGIYRRAWEAGDFTTALAAEIETCKLVGLYQSERK